MVPVELLLAGAAEHRQATGRPLVTLSYAQSLDGSIATRRGSPLRLSGPESMALTHRLRAAHDAILVGIGTLLADDPRLNVRLAPGRDPQPVVLDSRLRIRFEARLLHGSCLPWVATLPDADPQKQIQLQEHGVRLLKLPAGADGLVSLPALLRSLAESGINSLMVEGGTSVLTAFLRQKLVDRLVLTIAPVLVGGLRAIEEAGEISNLPYVMDVGYERLGDDLIVWGKISG
jgi:3,4-dihydroxy 2-butanone 4-phosphate synthase/GTP cyclohydrolase II